MYETGDPAASSALTRRPLPSGADLERVIETTAGRGGLARLIGGMLSSPTGLLGLGILLVLVLTSFGAPLITKTGPLTTSPDILVAPNSQHWFGTDQFGRDVFSRLLFGGQLSLRIGFVSVAIGAVIGTAIGLVAGFYRSAVEVVLMRFIDALMAFPELLLALAIAAVVGPGLNQLSAAIGGALIPSFARVVRAAVLQVKETEYYDAAVSMGASNVRLMVRHILPNIVTPIVVLATIQLATAILTGAALSFLGLGAPPPAPEWGSMVNAGKAFLPESWWLTAFPGLTITLALVSINFVGDVLREAVDPRSTRIGQS